MIKTFDYYVNQGMDYVKALTVILDLTSTVHLGNETSSMVKKSFPYKGISIFLCLGLNCFSFSLIMYDNNSVLKYFLAVVG